MRGCEERYTPLASLGRYDSALGVRMLVGAGVPDSPIAAEAKDPINAPFSRGLSLSKNYAAILRDRVAGACVGGKGPPAR